MVGITMTRYSVDQTAKAKFDPFDPARLRAHNQAGFSSVYQLEDNIVTRAVEAITYSAAPAFVNLTGPISLKLRIQANLIRLFQLAVLFDDFFPTNPDEKSLPDRLMVIIEALWLIDVPTTTPTLGAAAMRTILDHWYARHLLWWKANRRSRGRLAAATASWCWSV
jgi:hypothetical protein